MLLSMAIAFLLLAWLVRLAWAEPRRYRRAYPTLSRICVALLAALLLANRAAPALEVPVWSVFAAATLNALLFALLWLPRLVGGAGAARSG